MGPMRFERMTSRLSAGCTTGYATGPIHLYWCLQILYNIQLKGYVRTLPRIIREWCPVKNRQGEQHGTNSGDRRPPGKKAAQMAALGDTTADPLPRTVARKRYGPSWFSRDRRHFRTGMF